MNEREAVCLMFDRPLEPLIVPKGEKIAMDIDLPDNFLILRYRVLKQKIKKRFEKKVVRRIPIKNTSIPDITLPLLLPKMGNFSLFIPQHRNIAGSMIDIFMSQRTVEDLAAVAAYCRDRLNPYLFNYSLSVALLHRNDTSDWVLPNFLHSFPGKFLNSTFFCMARKELMIIPEDFREPIVIPKDFTASDREPEQKVAYFREDIGINLHHWHWHLVYPFTAKDPGLVAKDRRGELFYYMHQQILARYNAERLCNDLKRVISLSSLRERIPEGYFPKLEQLNSNRAWPPRFANSFLYDIDRPNDKFVQSIKSLEDWIENIKDAIKKGYATDKQGNAVPLDDFKGIDILGNMLESTILSPNKDLYGDLHNMGHIVIAFCHDPEYKYLENFGVMGDTATAMRDPVFYRWHKSINDLFVSLKNKLPYYTRAQLDYEGIVVRSLKVSTPNKQENELHTHWELTSVDMSRGLDFAPRGPLTIRMTHLQHQPFTFTIKIKNSTPTRIIGTVRLFMAPKFDEKNEVFLFEEQRKLMIELDKFTVALRPGDNTIVRESDESSVTIPYDKTFRTIYNYTDPEEQRKYNICGCGWPDHMMIPKGTTSGFPVNVFVMVSNYTKDNVSQDMSDISMGAESYCGLMDKKYPDAQSMGYPFDRVAKDGVTRLQDFLTANMKVIDAVIIHTDETIPRDDGYDRSYQVNQVKPESKERFKGSDIGVGLVKHISESMQNVGF